MTASYAYATFPGYRFARIGMSQAAITALAAQWAALSPDAQADQGALIASSPDDYVASIAAQFPAPLNAAVSAVKGVNPPTNPAIDDLWYNSGTDAWERWNGSSWVITGGGGGGGVDATARANIATLSATVTGNAATIATLSTTVTGHTAAITGNTTAISTLSVTVTGHTAALVPYGLNVGKGLMTVPVGLHTHHAYDVVSNGTDTQISFRFFVPLTDPALDSILPGFSNQAVSTVGGATDTDAPNPITLAVSIETSDGVNVPFTWQGGNHTVSIAAAGSPLIFPDAPLSFGAQVAATDKFGAATPLTGVWMRTTVTVPAAVTSSTGTTTSGSPTITDAAASTAWDRRVVSGTGIPTSNNTYVCNVVAGTSYQLSSTPPSQVITLVNATASGTPTLTIKSMIPFNIAPEYTGDAASLNNAADATLYGAAAPSGGAYSAYYGPSVVFGRSALRKVIPASVGDSIFDGYAEDFHSSYQGPVSRAVRAYGHHALVKLNRGGETALSFNAPSTRRFRTAMLVGCTHAIVEYGTNDGINSGSQATNIINRLVAIGNYLNGLGIKAWICTIPPRTSSTDVWATTGNQTDISLTANLATINQAIRGLTTGLSVYKGVIDLEGACSSAQDSGKWAASKTGDGVHPNDATMRGAVQTIVNNVVSTWSLP